MTGKKRSHNPGLTTRCPSAQMMLEIDGHALVLEKYYDPNFDAPPSPTTVVNWRQCKEGVIYIGRGRGGNPTKWGNPFPLPKHPSEQDLVVCLLRYAWHVHDRRLYEDVHEDLAGKKLGCFCHPKRCHGDILARIADAKNPRRELGKIIDELRAELRVLVNKDLEVGVDPLVQSLVVRRAL
jgi:hypothetical protein